MKFIIGKKIEMTQVWQDETVVAVTKVKAGRCVVTQVKNIEKDGYSSVQLGFGVRKEKNIKKPQKGHFKKLGNFAKVREFRLSNEEAEKLKTGDIIDISSFVSGDKIQVTSTSKGKGFQGVVKRYGFKGTKKTHGNKDQLRMPGSIGATGPAHVFKGTRMGGRMGGDRVTIKNLEVAGVDLENNILFIKGPVSGARNSLVLVSGEGELKLVESEKVESKTVETQNVASKSEKEKESEVKNDDKNIENKTVETQNIASEKEKKAETPEEVEKEVVEAKEKVDGKNKN
ncbi:50S ribosomal protein L3 [Candidatus Parcubacteria bacterium]|nr:50S ribosomal protein L3 [Candidatus Parcubacteria bacterium]